MEKQNENKVSQDDGYLNFHNYIIKRYSDSLDIK